MVLLINTMAFSAAFLKFLGSRAFYITLLTVCATIVFITLISMTILNNDKPDAIETTTLIEGSGSGDFSGSGSIETSTSLEGSGSGDYNTGSGSIETMTLFEGSESGDFLGLESEALQLLNCE